MVEVFYRYRIPPSQARAFEHAFGADGPWARLFGVHPGYRRTRLFRHRQDPTVYLSVDVWDEKADWDAFRATHAAESLELDHQLHLLYLEEHLLGFYAGQAEYDAMDATE